MNEVQALKKAIAHAKLSPCAKSKRGVVLFNRVTDYTFGSGYNSPPLPFHCDGSEHCRLHCSKLCVHAEQAAIYSIMGAGMRPEHLRELEMLHVKVVDGAPVASGPPSCWECSKMVMELRLAKVWLLHELNDYEWYGAEPVPIEIVATGLRSYTAEEFHRMTLETCGLARRG